MNTSAIELEKINTQIELLNTEIATQIAGFLGVDPSRISAEFVKKFESIRQDILSKIPEAETRYQAERKKFFAEHNTSVATKKGKRAKKSPPVSYSDPRVQNIASEEKKVLQLWADAVGFEASPDICIRSILALRKRAQLVLETGSDGSPVQGVTREHADCLRGIAQAHRMANFLARSKR